MMSERSQRESVCESDESEMRREKKREKSREKRRENSREKR